MIKLKGVRVVTTTQCELSSSLRLPPSLALFLSLQVSHLHGLALFEDFLFTACSEPSRGSAVEVLRINRFNGTDTRTLITLHSLKEVRVYHKLTQPTGKHLIL